MGFIGKQPSKAAITSSDITDGVVTAAKLASDSVTTAKIADNGVTTAKINADAVTDAKIADDVVGSEHLTAGEVDTTALGADAVTAAKIADDAISEEHLDATVITGMTELAAEPADTDEFLISDAGTLKRIDYSHIKGSGGLVKLAQTAASGASTVSFDGYFSSTYDNYVFFLNGMYHSGAGDLYVRFRVSNSDVTDSDYAFHVGRGHRDASNNYWENNVGGWNQNYSTITGDNVGTSVLLSYDGRVYMFNPLASSKTKAISDLVYMRSADNAIERPIGHVVLSSSSAASGITFYPSTGTITGTITLYGIIK